MSRELDLVVYGATGFTGALVAEHLLSHHEPHGLRLGLAGRDAAKLERLADRLGGDAVLIEAAASDPASLAALAARSRAVISTVGPYQFYGEGLVAACAAEGTDYLDLCGEPAWMRRMIDRYAGAAEAHKARILFSCGFDSIPFELGVFAVQELARQRWGAPAPRVNARVLGMRAGLSGGTAASLEASRKAAAADRETAELLADPFALTPGFRGPPQPDLGAVEFDRDLQAWIAPFAMAPINSRNVHRSNVLLGHAYGEDFTYDERLVAGRGPQGQAQAQAIAAQRARARPPRLGEGPSRAERAAGFYDLAFLAARPGGTLAQVRVRGDMDPGYGSTSKMIAETALCLLDEGEDVSGGVWTPGAALGERLIARLEARAGLSFSPQWS